MCFWVEPELTKFLYCRTDEMGCELFWEWLSAGQGAWQSQGPAELPTCPLRKGMCFMWEHRWSFQMVFRGQGVEAEWHQDLLQGIYTYSKYDSISVEYSSTKNHMVLFFYWFNLSKNIQDETVVKVNLCCLFLPFTNYLCDVCRKRLQQVQLKRSRSYKPSLGTASF